MVLSSKLDTAYLRWLVGEEYGALVLRRIHDLLINVDWLQQVFIFLVNHDIACRIVIEIDDLAHVVGAMGFRLADIFPQRHFLS